MTFGGGLIGRGVIGGVPACRLRGGASCGWRGAGGGALTATLVNGYAPDRSARFDVVVTGSSVAGAFASVDLPAPGDPLREWITVYQGDRVLVVYTSIADWNRDGVLNSTDVSDFINDWFVDQLKGTLITDFNGDGTSNSTDVSDFINLWFEDEGP